QQDGGRMEGHHHGETGDTRPVEALVLLAVPVKGRGVLRHAGNSILAGPRAPRVMSGPVPWFCTGIPKLIPIPARRSTAPSVTLLAIGLPGQQPARLVRIRQALVQGLLRRLLRLGVPALVEERLGEVQVGGAVLV